MRRWHPEVLLCPSIAFREIVEAIGLLGASSAAAATAATAALVPLMLEYDWDGNELEPNHLWLRRALEAVGTIKDSKIERMFMKILRRAPSLSDKEMVAAILLRRDPNRDIGLLAQYLRYEWLIEYGICLFRKNGLFHRLFGAKPQTLRLSNKSCVR
jgi:hypothetical protein